jgi:hypothetical protein
LVCDRDRVIVRIDRVGAHGTTVESDAEWLDGLEQRGHPARSGEAHEGMACPEAPGRSEGGGGPPPRARRGTVRGWDSSAVGPLLVEPGPSSRVATWVAEDDTMVLGTLTPVEVTSALRGLVREQVLAEEIARLAEDWMNELVRACHVIIDIDPVKSLAARLPRLDPLSLPRRPPVRRLARKRLADATHLMTKVLQ